MGMSDDHLFEWSRPLPANRLIVAMATMLLATGCFAAIKGDGGRAATLSAFRCDEAQMISGPILARGYLRYVGYPGQVAALHLFDDQAVYASRSLSRSMLVIDGGEALAEKERIEGRFVHVSGQPRCVRGPDSISYKMALVDASIGSISPDAERIDQDVSDVGESVQEVDDARRAAADEFFRHVRSRDAGSAARFFDLAYAGLPRDAYYRRRLDWVLFESPTSVAAHLSRASQIESKLRIFRLAADDSVFYACFVKNSLLAADTVHLDRLSNPANSGDDFCVPMERAGDGFKVGRVQYDLAFVPVPFAP